MMKIAICDDDVTLANDIGLFINRIGERYHLNISTKIYTESPKLQKAISQGITYDVIYVRMRMMHIDGIELSYFIRDKLPHADIIFVTCQEYIDMELFNVQPFQCMPLPLDWKQLESDFLKLAKRYGTNEMFYQFSFNKVQYRTHIKDIMYFESKLRTCELVCDDGFRGVFTSKLDEVEAQMSKLMQQFIRVHRSYLVHFRYIRSIQKQEVVLYDGTRFPISADRWDEVSRKYTHYIECEKCRYRGLECTTCHFLEAERMLAY